MEEKLIEEIFNEVIYVRRQIHKNPEVGLYLPYTKKIILSELEKDKIEYEMIGESILAKIISDSNNKNILLRADIDALPMKENTNLEFKSLNNYHHGCGHDIHLSSLLGYLKFLKRSNKKINKNIYAIFQPDEEGGKGAKNALENGLFEKYKFDNAFAIHLDAKLPLGTISYGYGMSFASNHNLLIKIKGKSSHGARAYEGIDSINIGVKLYNLFYSVIFRELNVFNNNIFSITSFNAGNTFNIIADECEIKATLRTYTNDAEYILQRFNDIVKVLKKLYNIDIELNILNEIPVLNTDKEFTDKILKKIKNTDTKFIKKITQDNVIKLGSEDFAFISNNVKSAYFFVGAGIDYNNGSIYGQHNSNVIFNEKSILTAMELHDLVVDL